jgi:hypothetical protein
MWVQAREKVQVDDPTTALINACTAAEDFRTFHDSSWTPHIARGERRLFSVDDAIPNFVDGYLPPEDG